MVGALCRLLLRDAAEAEDATQQAFLSAYRVILAGTRPREPAAWLATIARNECRARARARMRRPLLEPEAWSELPDTVAEAVRRADLRALWQAIAELPPRQRKAFVLRELAGLSYQELAVALGVSGPAVESLLVRARTRLRAALEAALQPLGCLAPIFGRLLTPPAGTKVAAATLGVGLVAGGTVAVERSERPSPPAAPLTAPTIAASVPAHPFVRVVRAELLTAATRPVRLTRRQQGERSESAERERRGETSEESGTRVEMTAGDDRVAAEAQVQVLSVDAELSGGTEPSSPPEGGNESNDE